MKFLLFSKISFEVSYPVALIESYCFQSNFYANYVFLSDRYVNKIGARLEGKLLPKCEAVTKNIKTLHIFKYDLDGFLKLNDKTRNYHIKELNHRTIRKLLKIKGIRLSIATKVLHTLYPKIIPMIDRALQKEYRNKINSQWTDGQSDQILIDYYNNLREDDNWQHLTQIFDIISKNNLIGLTKLRIFDILWWSYLKSKKLRQKGNINWSTIK